ncbi:MAG: phosphatase PAP2 family protein [Bacilli bacterium]
MRRVLLAIFLLIFTLTSFYVTSGTNTIETTLSETLLLTNATAIAFWKGVTTFTSTVFAVSVTLIFAGVLFFHLRSWKDGAAFILFVLLMQFTYKLTKDVFLRPRPEVNTIVFQDGYSYVSGHSLMAVTLYGAICYYLLKYYVKTSHLRTLVLFTTATIIVLVGTSRVLLGAHYISDVVGGFSLGAVCLLMYVLFLERFGKNN